MSNIFSSKPKDYSRLNQEEGGEPPLAQDNAGYSNWWWLFWGPFFFLLFVGASLGITGFAQVNSQWSYITQHQCNPQYVDQFGLTERIFDTKRTDWPSWSKTLQSTRYNPHVNVKNVYNWQYICGNGTQAYAILNTNNGISATPTTSYDLNMIFVPTWGYNNGTGSYLHAIYASTCNIAWSVAMANLTSQTGVPGNDPNGVINPNVTVRNSLTVFQNRTGGINLIFGDLGTSATYNITTCPNVTVCGARVYAIEASTGKLLWRTLIIEPTPITGYARQSDAITSSPTVVGSEAYFGMSSTQTSTTAFTGYLDFYGRYFGVDVNSGALLWIHRVNSDQQIMDGNYGTSVWGSAPPYDYQSQQVFYGSGNLYNYSSSVAACLAAGHTRQYCMEDGINDDSVFGVRTNNDGERTWIYSPLGVDAWNEACAGFGNPHNCPINPGPDYDFGTGTIIIENQCGQRFLIALQKSGILYSFDVDTGNLAWTRYIGPGSFVIGSWGISFDGQQISFGWGNSEKRSYLDLQGNLRCDSFWVGVNPWTGHINWLTPAPCSQASATCASQVPFYDSLLTGIVPQSQLTYADRGIQRAAPALPCYGSVAEDYRNLPALASVNSGGVIVTNDYIFAGAWSGYMHAFNKQSGQIVYTFPRCPTGVIYGSASISLLQNNVQVLTWGCGYTKLGPIVDSVGSDALMMVSLPQ